MAALQAQEQQQSFDLSRLYVWLKGLEGKVNNLTREVNVLKNDYSKKGLQLKKDIKALSGELLELQHQRDSMLQRTDLIIKELKQTAGMEDVAVLKKYVEYWNPLSFVTQRDVERIVDAKLSEKTRPPEKNDEEGGKVHEKVKKAEHFTG